MRIKPLDFFCTLSLLSISLFSVSQSEVDSIVKIKFDDYRSKTPQEKIFVHTDRSFYVAGETIWFAIYNQDASMHKPIDISKVAYVEILDEHNVPITQAKIELVNGRGNGSIPLSLSIPSGNYLFRAYTQWMKNFDPDYYYQKPIAIVNTLRTTKNDMPSTPVISTLDVQFFPEGGSLIEGIESRVAFKVIDAEGKSMEFKGVLINQANDTVAHLHPLKFGMGSFRFTPQSKQTYQAVIREANGTVTKHSFLKAADKGYALSLVRDNNFLRLDINAKVDNAYAVFLLVHTRNRIVFSGKQKLLEGKATYTIDIAKLGEGISSFTLFDDANRPVCERLFFKSVSQKLLIDVTPNQGAYPVKSKVTFSMITQTTNQSFVPASLSVSIIRADSLEVVTQNHILPYLFLSSDLKGHIESPEYYFQLDNPEVTEAADNLMLTQGWRRFKWDEILSKKDSAFDYLPEFRGHLIKGRVIEGATRNAAKGVSILLSSPSAEGRFYSGVSNEKGQVFFELKNFYGTHPLIGQAGRPNDSVYYFEVIDPFSSQFSKIHLPTFSLEKEWKNTLTKRSIHMQVQTVFQKDLQNAAKNPQTDATFYGKPDEHYLLSDYTRFTSMEDVMREYVKGVWVRKQNDKFYFLLPHSFEKRVMKEPLATVDGLPTSDFNSIMNLDPLKIKQVDVFSKKVYLGSLTYEGLIAITSYKGDLAGLSLDAKQNTQLYDGLQEKREFYSPRYEPSSSRNRIPDFRELLYSNSSVTTDAIGKTQLEFYTSELEGTYYIITQGITDQGIAGSSITKFTVSGN